MIRWLCGLAVLLLAAGELGAQVRPPVPADTGARADSIRRARGDTLRAGRDSAGPPIRWVEPDSVMQALLNKPGYVVTRYQGPILTFDALARAIDVFGRDTARAAVEREGRLLVADSSIQYREATGFAEARGVIDLRDGDQVLRGMGGTYNLRERSATIRGGRTTVRTEEEWLVSADVMKIAAADTANPEAGQNVFGRSGILTSCTDTTHGPHYHFHFKELKRTAGNTMVARPAVLYIGDIPVMWLPFVFQDMRQGRRSGLLTPRFGLTDLIRNTPSYRRNIENLGYYWMINDYMDFATTFDWLSNAGRGANEAPGWSRFNAEWNYKWIDRFLQGSIGSSYTRQGDGQRNLAVTWSHTQEFTRNRSIRANVNWMQNTTVQRQTVINPFAVLATISSQVNLQDKFGPASVSLGATRKQYTGRDETEQTFPTLSITTPTLNLRPWLSWTPSFQFSQQERKDITQTSQFGLGALFREQDGRLVVDSIRQNERRTSASLETPFEIFGFNLRNSFTFSEQEVNFPQVIRLVSRDTTLPDQDRVFSRTYESRLDWTPSFSLPSFAQGTWNLTPSVSLANVDAGPFMLRSQLSGGEWVRQSKRPTLGVSISPTFYGLFPGFAGFSRIRHAITTGLSYSWAPRAEVSDEFLLAQNRSRRGYIGALQQNQVSLSLSTNLEAKGRPAPGDTTANAASATPVKLLSLNFSPLSYDISRFQELKRRAALAGNDVDLLRGISSSNLSTSIRSDLLPGVDFSVDYSLFSGDVMSDTAQFSPYLTRVSGSFQLNSQRNPFMLLTRLFGRATPKTSITQAEVVEPLDDAAARRTAVQPIAGSSQRDQRFVVPPREGWEASFTFSSSRQRPPTGNANIVEYDPAILCEPLRTVNPLAYNNCVQQAQTNPSTEAPVTSPQSGGAFYRVPPTTSVGANLRFNLTPKWSGGWQTTYDVERSEFASHIVSLQRDLHDWRAVFAFTQSPNGSFAFNFFIALKAEPDLKFDYNRATYRQDVQRTP